MKGQNAMADAENIYDCDPLTGLMSFYKFKEKLARILSERNGLSYIVVYSDFENFKYFNRRYGYSAGDNLLKEFSKYILSANVTNAEIYFTRVVSDQFAVILQYSKMDEAEATVCDINQRFIESYIKDYQSGIRLRIRTGIYQIEPDCKTASEAIDAANYARKHVKNSSKCQVRVYDDELRKKQILEEEIVNGIDEAFEKHQFRVYLQPKFSMKDYSIAGAEALVRWQRDDGTLLYPDSFIPLFEKNGRVVDLDFYVFEQVAAFLAKNKELGRKQLPISINASILHAVDENTVNRYVDILHKYGVDPELTEIELTETATVSEFENVRLLFERLQNVHMRTSLDDFGAGYSLLNTVIDLPMDTLKIDRAFLTSCASSDKGIYLLQSLINMVKGLGYHVICEGVETKSQAELLRNAGCEEGQGYWFAKPMPMEDYEKLVYGQND